MNQIILKPFQIKSIELLKKEAKHKWDGDTRRTIKFQSPTGSGKTVIMAEFVRELFSDPELHDSDFCFMWATTGGSQETGLAQQSRRKFKEYYGGVSIVDTTDLDSITADKVIKRNEILFFNWAMVNVHDEQGRRLRTPNEYGITWDSMLERTRNKGRHIILIIDEAHTGSETILAEEQIQLINPKIVIRVTATHRQQDNIDVNIPHNDVVNAELIKKSIITQTKDDFRGQKVGEIDKHILKIALQKRKKLQELYKDRELDINPLLLIQLPNDESTTLESHAKKKWVLTMLAQLGVKSNKIAIWLAKEKTHLDNIEMNDNDTDVLLFKQAPSVGWDCPRAQIIVMYREIQNPIFQVQVLGRILRMPQARHYAECEELNHSYLYTTYDKPSVMLAYEKSIDKNIAAPYSAQRKSTIKPIKLPTYKTGQMRHRELDPVEFQPVFINVANKMCQSNLKRQMIKDFKGNKGVPSIMVVDAKITDFNDYDNFIKQIRQAPDLSQPLSSYDVQKLYDKLCIYVLRQQEGYAKIGNVSRSYSVLKSALNVWFEEHLKMRDKVKYYPVIVNDLLEGSNSELLKIINKAIEEYIRVIGKEEKAQEKNELRKEPIEIPRAKVSYTIRYQQEDHKKCAMTPCYVEKSNQNERNFIAHLEGNKKVVWWYKNGDNGADNFSVKRDTGELFFPDWFVMTKSKKLWILETKSGNTAEGKEAESRAAALRKWLAKNKEYKGGLIKEYSGLWEIATDDNLQKWENLEF